MTNEFIGCEVLNFSRHEVKRVQLFENVWEVIANCGGKFYINAEVRVFMIH